MDKHEISQVLKNIGMLLEIKGESFFKSKAYYDAARTLDLMDEDLEKLVEENRLKELKGFGVALVQKVTELVSTGKLEYYESLIASVPSGLLDLLQIQGLGSKKIKILYEELNITNIKELREACVENKLSGLKGFGEKTQTRILDGIDNLGKYVGQYYYFHAEATALAIVNDLQNSGLVDRCSVAGSLRRKKEVVKDIDILVGSSKNTEVMDFFTSHPLVEQITSKGETKSSVILKDGINSDLRVVEDSSYSYALHHFTGSKEHNTAMRHMAKQQGIKMNEYGLFREDEIIPCKNEQEIFKVFNMDYIEPELRENNGEIEAALEGKLPVLVKESDIQGVIHVHTTYSDGISTIEELVKGCISRGYSYLGISDHSEAAYYANGLKKDAIKRQHDEIDNLRLKYPGFSIYKGIELDILPQGIVDYNDEILSWFDFTIASVHSGFAMDEDKMTERIISAIKNPFVKILGHPTGRLLLSREPYKLNLTAVLEACVKHNVIVEINSNPERLDLDWRVCKLAKELGCRFAICPDAHSVDSLGYIKYGVNTARKGWLTKQDIINTKNSKEFEKKCIL